MWNFLKRLFGGTARKPAAKVSPVIQRLIGTWNPVGGDPRECLEFRANGTARMATFGGVMQMEGRYQFMPPNAVRITWGEEPSDDARAAVAALNEGLANEPDAPQMRIVQETILQIEVTETELHTLHIQKGRRGHYRRAEAVATSAPAAPAAPAPPTAMLARLVLNGQPFYPVDRMFEMAREAGQEVIRTAREQGYQLDFSSESIIMLDIILQQLHKEGRTPEVIPTVLLGIGWYLGEMMIREHGGRWQDRTAVQPPTADGGAMVVELPDGRVLDPIRQTLRCLQHGMDESIALYCLSAGRID